MSLTNDQLEERILSIEEKINDIQEAILKLATKRQLNSLAAQFTTETTQAAPDLVDLETSVNNIQVALNKLPTKRQLNSTVGIIQPQIADLTTAVETLQMLVSGLLQNQ